MAVSRTGGSRNEPLLPPPGKPDPHKKLNQTIKKVCLGIFQALHGIFKAIHSGLKGIVFKATKTTPSKFPNSSDKKAQRLAELQKFQKNFEDLTYLQNTNRQEIIESYDPHYEVIKETRWVNNQSIDEGNLFVDKELKKFMKEHIAKPEEKLSKPELWDDIKTLVAEKFQIPLDRLAKIQGSQDIPHLLEQRFEKYQGFANELYQAHTSENSYADLQRALIAMELTDSRSQRPKNS